MASNMSKAMWPGVKQWYKQSFPPERLEDALSEDELVAKIATMMLFLKEGNPLPEIKEDVEEAVDNLLGARFKCTEGYNTGWIDPTAVFGEFKK